MVFDIYKIKFLFIIFFVVFVPFFCFAAKPLDVVINEIAWMGTENSSNDEWLELRSNINSDIDLNGWRLVAADGTPEILLTGKIKSEGFFVLERTDDNTIPDIQADQIYKGVLNNQGEFLKLIDNLGNIIDQVDCLKGWLAGNNFTKQTMERIDKKALGSSQNNWQESEKPGGTPGATNTNLLKLITQKENSKEKTEEEAKAIQSETETGSWSISGIVISELLPSAKGPDDKEEFIEIFNQNDFEVGLEGWSLQDTQGKTTNFIFAEKTKIGPKQFLAFFRPETKITLNNSKDGLRILNSRAEIVDEIYYEKAVTGQSFNKTALGWSWSSYPTPGRENIISQKEKTTDKEQKNNVLDLTTDSLEQNLSAGLSKISFGDLTVKIISRDFLFVLGLACFIAFFFAVLILSLKKRFKA